MNSKLGPLGVFGGMCLCSQSARKFRKPKLKSGLGKEGEEDVISNAQGGESATRIQYRVCPLRLHGTAKNSHGAVLCGSKQMASEGSSYLLSQANVTYDEVPRGVVAGLLKRCASKAKTGALKP